MIEASLSGMSRFVPQTLVFALSFLTLGTVAPAQKITGTPGLTRRNYHYRRKTTPAARPKVRWCDQG
jgi:hypothetical protein